MLTFALPICASLELISRADPNQSSATAGALIVSQVNQRAFSADGRYVVFVSSSQNLIDGFTAEKASANVYLHDRVTKTSVLVSHAAGSPTTAANGDSFVPTIDAEGRFVVYWTFASDVVPQADQNESTPDVFIYDRTTGTNTLVSHVPGDPNQGGDSNSYDPAISADGRFVSFTSAASNLVDGQTDGGAFSNIFVWDRVNDTTTLVSHRSGDFATTTDGSQFNSIVSDDGSFVAYLSNASNVVAGQSQPARRYQVFLWSRTSNQSVMVSHNATSQTAAPDGASFYPILDADASHVAFYSAGTDVVTDQVDLNQGMDVFVYERATGAIRLVSHTRGSATTTGAMGSIYPDVSGDGRYVVYQSTAPDLVANDLNGAEDVFVWDRTTGENAVLSRSATPLVSASANAKSYNQKISRDGRFVSFTSDATDLLAGQSGTGGNIFLVDRTTSTMRLVSRTPGSATTGGDAASFRALVNSDGAFVTFNTQAGNLVAGDTNGSGDVMIYSRAADTNAAASARAASLASVSANGHSGSQRTSADGRFVVFVSDATNLVPNQSDANGANDIFVRDRQTGTTKLVSHAAGSPSTAADALSDSPAISADGRWIAYASLATDIAGLDLNGGADIYLYDRVNDVTTLVSHSVAGAGFTASDVSQTPAISGDGRFVAYASYAADLIAAQSDSNADLDVFVFDRTTGTNALVSHDSVAPNATGISYSFAPAISQDGAFVAYYSAALNLVADQSNAGESVQHCFLYDRVANTNVMVDHQPGAAATSGDGNAGSTEPLDPPVFSADGKYLAYASTSTNLVSGQTDTNSDYDIFLFDCVAGTNLLVSHRADSLTTTGTGGIAYNPSINADGRFVSYRSAQNDLVAGQIDGTTFQNVFLFDRQTRTNALVSHAFGAPTAEGNGLAGEAPRYGYQSVSPDGRFVAFWSSSTNLIPDFVDRNGLKGDLFVFDRTTSLNVSVSHPAGAVSTGGNNGSGDSFHNGGPLWSADGRWLFFGSEASTLIPGDFNNRSDVLGIEATAIMMPPLPSIASVDAGAACQGGPDFTLTVNGANFVASSVVQVGGSARATTFVDASQLRVAILSDDTVSGSFLIRVANSDGVSAPVTVNVIPDVTGPVVTPPDALTIRQTACGASGGGATGTTSPELAAFLVGGSAVDGCSTSVVRLQDMSDVTFFGGGTTSVMFRYRDRAGNIGASAATVTVVLLADLNVDAAVDAQDLVIMGNHLVGNVPAGTAPFNAAAVEADVNGDGNRNVVDLVIMANYLVGNIACLR